MGHDPDWPHHYQCGRVPQAFLIGHLGRSSEAAVQDAGQPKTGTEVRDEVTLVIDGMDCESCAQRLEKELRKVDGVHEVSVKFAETRARIVFDPGRVTATGLDEAIKSLGFESRAEPH